MFDPDTWVGNTIGLGILLGVALLMHIVIRPWLLRKLEQEIHDSPIRWDDVLLERHVPARLGVCLPILVLFVGVGLVPGLTAELVAGSRRVLAAALISALLLTALALTKAADDIYQHYYVDAHARPIKGYLQLVNMALIAVAAVLLVSTLSGRSPVVILSGIGALMAVILLMFSDSITGLVASVQIHNDDLVKVGDWIEVGGVEGEVTDLSLHSVTIRQSDMTISVLPVRTLTTSAFTNWRAMYEAGGRRIKRAINVDLTTIRFLTDDELEALDDKDLLHVPEEKVQEALAQISRPTDQDTPTIEPYRKRITNVGAFRAYADAYLHNHPKLHHEGMTTLVRPLAPSPDGLPIEVYAFARDTGFEAFENIQADVFDHLLSVVPEFGLRVFQNPVAQHVMNLPAAPGATRGRVGPGRAVGVPLADTGLTQPDAPEPAVSATGAEPATSEVSTNNVAPAPGVA